MKLKDLVQLKKPKNERNIVESTEEKSVREISERERKKTYCDDGFKHSTHNFGDATALRVSLKAIYGEFQNKEKANKEKQEELKQPDRERRAAEETQVRTNEVVLENTEEKANKRQKTIEILKNEIADIPNNPKKYGIPSAKGSAIKFWIGLFILIPIILYLFTFYISTSYSAFFKQFQIGDEGNFFQTILDPNAFTKAWQEGALEGMFVSFIPFVFMGLGFLIHMFNESKNISGYIKIAILVIITFIFDVILAYQIEQHLYNLEKTTDSPNFNLNIAFQTTEFWGIIFAGFVVYIILGLVFDFVMLEHKKRDQFTMAIDERKRKIKIENDNLNIKEKEIDKLKEKIEKHKGYIVELDIKINGIIIPVREYRQCASDYVQGWITAINQNLHGSEDIKQELIEKSNQVYEGHINEVGANGAQNIIYT